MFLADRLTLDAPRRTKDGYLAVRAKASRVGVYDYLGREIDPENKHGLRDRGTVNVLRDEETVFDDASARSFIGKPVTDDHPRDPVTADNWKQHARGMVMGAMRDGDYLAFDLLLTDADAISKVDAGKRELSNGYAAELEFGDFTAPDGTRCAARQTRISGNHVALVDKGRAGPECRITDAAACTSAFPAQLFIDWLDSQRTYQPQNDGANLPASRRDDVSSLDGGRMATKLITFDGLPVEVTDAAEAVIVKLQGQLRDSQSTIGTLTADLETARKAVETKDGEIVVLKKQLDDANDPTKQAARDAARAKVIAGAQALKPGITVDGKTDAAIRKEAVEAHLGDAAKDLSDDAIVGAFAAATKDVKPADPVRNAIMSQPQNVADSATVRDAARAHRYAN